MRSVKDWAWLYGFMAVVGVAVGLVIACSDPPVAPTPLAVADPTPEPEAPAPAAQPGSGRSWTSNGVLVEVLHDGWGPGNCHAGGGMRRLRITNNRSVTIYSNLAAYTDPSLVCVNSTNPTGDPEMIGPKNLDPGEVGVVEYHISPPKCGSLQADDCWGPGGIQGCSFVIGDAFKSDEVCDECVEDPKESSSIECGEWNKCHEHPDTELCWQEKECVETKTVDYQCKDDVVTEREYEEVQTCACTQECVDKPTGVVGHLLNRTYSAGAQFEDSGDWMLRVSASSRESECTSNQPDYWKRTLPKTLKCDERGELSTTYPWAGHRAEWWRAILYRNGVVVDQTACERNPWN